MSHARAYTAVELVFTVIVIALIAGIAIPILAPGGRRCGCGRQMQSSTQVRGIIQGMVNFSPGNNEWYPGLNTYGKRDTTPLLKSSTLAGAATADGYLPEYRYALMIRNSYFSPEYAISPNETDAKINSPVKVNEDIADKHYSFTMLTLQDETGSRRKEWKQTTNSKAIVMTDRNIGPTAGVGAAGGAAASIYHPNGPWRGTIGYNDNHVMFETTQVIKDTVYAQQAQVPADNIFTRDLDENGAAGNDALMTYQSGVADDGQVNQKPK